LHRERKEISDSTEDLFALAAGVGKRNQADGFGKIRFAQKIPVPGGNLAEFSTSGEYSFIRPYM